MDMEKEGAEVEGGKGVFIGTLLKVKMRGTEGTHTERIIISTAENLIISSRKTKKVLQEARGQLLYDIGVMYLLGYNFCSVGLFFFLIVVTLSDLKLDFVNL